MAETKLTRDHHLLTRNLKLNGNYLSNDGGDEGIKISDAGAVTIYPGAQVFEFTDQFKMFASNDTDDYFKIQVDTTEGGKTTLSTTQDDGGNTADMIFDADGDVTFSPGATNKFFIENTTKTASGNFDSSLRITETIDMGSGADGDDFHGGIWYTQTQTNLAGWDNVYLMYLDGGNKFTVDDKAQLFIDINDIATTSVTNKGIHVDIDGTGILLASQTSTNIGLDIDINRDSGNGHSSSTTNTTGIDIDLVGHANGTTTNIGINIAVSAADTNYALITSGGNVGIGESAPQDTLEVNGTMLVKDKLKFTQDDGNEYIDSLNDGYLDIDATTAIRLKADTLIEGTKKLYFNDEGGEYISGTGSDITITSGGNLNIDASGQVEFDGCGVGFDLETPSYNASDTDVDFTNGNKQFVTFDGGNITDLNLIFPKVSGNFLLMLKQDGTGERTVTNYKVWDRVNSAEASGSATVKFPGGNNPNLTDDANHVDIISFFYDGDNEIAYGVASLDFQF